jgi:uncharacterized protein YggU (UPF0235/DUF167 family)
MYVKVHATPGARKELVTKQSDTEFHIAVRERAERNMANKRIRELLAEAFKVPLSDVRILTGHRSSSKMYSIDVSYEE